MTAEEWIEAFAEAIGASAPEAETRTVLLELAGVAAHSSERIAAPIACFLAGQTGFDPKAALELAQALPGHGEEEEKGEGGAAGE